VRRLLAVVLALVPTVLVAAPTAAGAAAQARPADDVGRGLLYAGLQRSAPTGTCRGGFELASHDRFSALASQILCTHGPDPAPQGVDVRQARNAQAVAGTALPRTAGTALPGIAAAAATTVPCYGTGSDGYRVQLLYARSSAAADRFDSFSASFVSAAARVDDVTNASAAETGGARHVRFVTDAACQPVINRVTLTPSGMADFNTMISELRSQGYNRSDRKYLVWADANQYCGIAQVYHDDSASTTPGVNASNGHPRVAGEVARVDNGCWALGNSVEAHELMHNLGGVQTTAPNATPASHCTDDADRMCYADGSVAASAIRQVCAASHEALFDCNHDDYFSTSPPAGSYLATHWNSASSVFLTSAAPGGTTTTTVPPTTTTTRPPTTTTTVPPTTVPPTTVPPTTVPPTTVPPTTVPPTTVPPTTTTVPPTTVPPTTGAKPSAPQALIARQSVSGPGVVLTWQAPVSGPVTGYRVYRSTSPFALGFLAGAGNVTQFSDTTTAPGVVYYYTVTALNGAGEGPASNITGMVGR